MHIVIGSTITCTVYTAQYLNSNNKNPFMLKIKLAIKRVFNYLDIQFLFTFAFYLQRKNYTNL